jgi:phytoene/squalene synthetase
VLLNRFPEPVNVNSSWIDWALLKGVSRSFYLTLRILPAPVRESIALAYLPRGFRTHSDGATSAARRLLERQERSKMDCRFPTEGSNQSGRRSAKAKF